MRWRDALLGWASTTQNPFWQLARRVEARRGHPARLWFWGVLIWGFLALCNHELLSSYEAHWGLLSPGEGRDAFGFLAFLWLSVMLAVSFVASRTRSNNLLRAMLLKGQLLPAQLTPITDEERAWNMTAHATLIGLFTALAALPALFFGLGHGDWLLSQLLGLFFLIVAGIWNVPKWAPHQWQAQIEKTGANQRTLFWKPHHLGIAWTGWRSVFLVLCFLWLSTPLLPLLVLGDLKESLGPEFERLLAVLWLDWPLLLSWLLTTPFPFFGFALPPLLLIVPLWMATQDRKLLRLTSILGANRSFWTAERQYRWQRDEHVMALLWLLLALGYLWPIFIVKARLSMFWTLGGVTFTPTQGALATWFHLCVLGATTAATALWRQTLDRYFSMGVQNKRNPHQILPFAWARARGALLVGVAIWLGSCLLGWQIPLSGRTLALSATTLALGGLWILVQMASGLALAASSLPKLKENLPLPPNPITMTFWWFYGVFLAINAPMWFISDGKLWQPWALGLSPFSLWLAPHYLQNVNTAWFWGALLFHALFGAGWLWWVWQLLPDAENVADSASKLASHSRDADVWTSFDWKPVEAKAPVGTVRVEQVRREHLHPIDAGQRSVYRWLERFNNPLLILETRRVMRHNNWLRACWQCFGWSMLLLFVITTLCFGDKTEQFPLASAGVMHFVFTTIIVLGLLMLRMPQTNNSYDRDRLDGTLESLFMTPLTDVAIAQSKVIPYLTELYLMVLFLGLSQLVSAGLASLNGQYDLWKALPGVVLSLLALITRNVMLAHFLALTSRKTGHGGLRMGLIGVPLIISEIVWLINKMAPDEMGMTAFFLYFCAISVEAVVLWFWAVLRLRALRRANQTRI